MFTTFMEAAMRIIGAGLNKTGTTSLARALEFLGYRVLQYDSQRLRPVVMGQEQRPSFRVYDDIDAVLDFPAAFFFEELLEAYPESRCILTLRDEDAWWASIRRHYNERDPTSDPQSFSFRMRLIAFGSPTATEFLYRKRFRQHVDRVRSVVPSDRLLTLDVSRPAAFSELGAFLGHPVPQGEGFPHANRADLTEELDAAADALAAATPTGSRIALLDGGWWWEGLSLPERRITRLGAGPPHWDAPPSPTEARDLVVDAFRGGCDHLAITVAAFWWLDHYEELRGYLDSHTTMLYRDWQLIVYRAQP